MELIASSAQDSFTHSAFYDYVLSFEHIWYFYFKSIRDSMPLTQSYLIIFYIIFYYVVWYLVCRFIPTPTNFYRNPAIYKIATHKKSIAHIFCKKFSKKTHALSCGLFRVVFPIQEKVRSGKSKIIYFRILRSL